MGIDLILREDRDDDVEGVWLSRVFTHGLLDEDGEVGSRLPPDLRARLEPDWDDHPREWTARDPSALRADLEAVRPFVLPHVDGPGARYSYRNRMTEAFTDSLDQAVAACDRAARAGRPVFWTAG